MVSSKMLLYERREAVDATVIETTFLIPLGNNDGVPFMRHDFAELESRLLASFGAWTVTGEVEGEWRSDSGRVFRDRSRRYVVALQSIRQVAALVSVLDWALARFEQEAIMLTIAGVPEILGPAPP